MELVTKNELAARLKVCPATIQRWRHDGLIPAIRIGHNEFRYDINAVVEALSTMKRPAPGPGLKKPLLTAGLGRCK